jgi:crossover junction endodeoxyribonuclease RuvC
MPLEALARRDPLIVVGIDPGTRRLGYGVVARAGGRLLHVDHGVFVASRDLDPVDRILVLRDSCRRLLDHHQPALVALEEAFVEKNVQSALRLGEVRGMILVTARERGLETADYPTATVKRRVGAHGALAKEALAAQVVHELGLAAPPSPFDASDALAIALCSLLDLRLDPRFAADPGLQEPLKAQSRRRR